MKLYELVGAIFLASVIAYAVVVQSRPMQPKQQTMTCYSPHDVYKVYDYEIADDNTTLITSHGRIYHMSECTKDK